jgi:hypothetical protein
MQSDQIHPQKDVVQLPHKMSKRQYFASETRPECGIHADACKSSGSLLCCGTAARLLVDGIIRATVTRV